MDTDKSARVTREEFERGLKLLGVKLPESDDYNALFRSIDVDTSNGITKPEIGRVLFGIEVSFARWACSSRPAPPACRPARFPSTRVQ